MLKNHKHLICALFISCLILSSSFARADAVLPGDVFTAIMLKALNYDRNIDRQAKDKVTIGIVTPADDPEAQGFAGQVRDNISKVQSTVLLKDKPVEARTLTLEKTFDKPKFEEQLKQNNISILVVVVNDPASVNNILEATKDLQISSICGNPGCVQNGVGLEIIQKDDKPHMLINLNTVKQEGGDYNSKFLAMCEVVK